MSGPERPLGRQKKPEHPERHRDHQGRFRRSQDALTRFLRYCRFDPVTGCVNWVGGETRGRGKTALYGTFWYEGRSWRVHRWAAQFIHGLKIDGLEVDHECGNTLCVHHLQAVSGQVNRELYWIRVQVGLEPEPEDERQANDGLPWFSPPEWLSAFDSQAAQPSHEPPF